MADTKGCTIAPQPNGPLLVRGGFALVDPEGARHDHAEPVALCRCGGSQNKPFCDGTHKRISFQAAGVPKD